MSNDTLISQLNRSDSRIVTDAIREIGRRRAREATPRLLQLLRTTDDGTIRNAAALALSDMEVPETFDAIVELLRDPRTVNNRGTLLYAVGTDTFDCRSILELLVELAISGNWETSRGALGLVNSIDGDVDAAQFRRAQQMLEAAFMTADTERREDIIGPLLTLFRKQE